MPNHVHLLIEIQKENYANSNVATAVQHIVETHCSASTHSISTSEIDGSLSKNRRETHCGASLQNQKGEKNELDSKLSRKSNSISSFVAVFKSVTTKQINGFESIWQTNYHDHIVRNYKTFEKIYDYIKYNPISWETDSINSSFQ